MPNLLSLNKKAMDQLMSNDMQSLGSDWYTYFGEKGVLVGKEDVMVFSFFEAFSGLPDIIDFFRVKIKNYFGAEPQDLRPNKGENIFDAVNRINKRLKDSDNDGKMFAHITFDATKFDEITIYDVRREITMSMAWSVFFVSLPRELSEMEVKYEKANKGG